jgi:tetratricopeptide (TPR) repeat protein
MLRPALVILLSCVAMAAAAPPATVPVANAAELWLRRASIEAQQAQLYKTPPYQGPSFISFVAAAQPRLHDREGLRSTHDYMSQRAAGASDPVAIVLNQGVLANIALRLDDQELYKSHVEKALGGVRQVGRDDPRFLLLDTFIGTIQAIGGDAASAARASSAASQPHQQARMRISLAIAALDRDDLPSFQRHMRAALAVALDDRFKANEVLYSIAEAFLRGGDVKTAIDAALTISDPFTRPVAFNKILDQQFQNNRAGYDATLARFCAAVDAQRKLGEKAVEYSQLIHGQLRRQDTDGLKRTLPPLLALAKDLKDSLIDWPMIAAAHAALGERDQSQAAREKCVSKNQYFMLAYALILAGDIQAGHEMAEKSDDRSRSTLYMTLAFVQARQGAIAKAVEEYQQVSDMSNKMHIAREIARRWASRADLPGLDKWIDGLKTPTERAYAAFGAAEGCANLQFFDPINTEIFGYGLN